MCWIEINGEAELYEVFEEWEKALNFLDSFTPKIEKDEFPLHFIIYFEDALMITCMFYLSPDNVENQINNATIPDINNTPESLNECKFLQNYEIPEKFKSILLRCEDY